mmetsp:Transcript_16453/g.24408  ORF Transcript_16453/g.24408 Transcript_16453/m.24408 type:complete len:98 (-) Transcript_16453:1885-2178(-)
MMHHNGNYAVHMFVVFLHVKLATMFVLQNFIDSVGSVPISVSNYRRPPSSDIEHNTRQPFINTQQRSSIFAIVVQINEIPAFVSMLCFSSYASKIVY